MLTRIKSHKKGIKEKKGQKRRMLAARKNFNEEAHADKAQIKPIESKTKSNINRRRFMHKLRNVVRPRTKHRLHRANELNYRALFLKHGELYFLLIFIVMAVLLACINNIHDDIYAFFRYINSTVKELGLDEYESSIKSLFKKVFGKKQ